MTVEDITNFGYVKFDAKIGTLYLKDNTFICKEMSDGVFDFRYVSTDEVTTSYVKTIEELKKEEIKYYKQLIRQYEMKITALKGILLYEYGCKN